MLKSDELITLLVELWNWFHVASPHSSSVYAEEKYGMMLWILGDRSEYLILMQRWKLVSENGLMLMMRMLGSNENRGLHHWYKSRIYKRRSYLSSYSLKYCGPSSRLFAWHNALVSGKRWKNRNYREIKCDIVKREAEGWLRIFSLNEVTCLMGMLGGKMDVYRLYCGPGVGRKNYNI